VAIADVYDALVSERPYKNAWSTEAAIDYMSTHSGKHFDPVCFNAFVEQLDTILKIQGMLPDLPATVII
jgi:HD-GYP domain-containing protein (c-di-GMP phosphodiesterase class II)